MDAKREQAGGGRQGIALTFLGFLERNLRHFHPRVRDLIGLGVLLLMFLLITHGLIAPSFIHGSLWVQEFKDGGKVQAEKYEIIMVNELGVVNLWGRWMLPLYQSGFPRTRRLEVYGPGRRPIARYSFVGPFPLWNALYPLELDLELHPYEAEGKRLRLAGHNVATTLARWLNAQQVFAQTSPPAPNPPLAPDRPPAPDRPFVLPGPPIVVPPGPAVPPGPVVPPIPLMKRAFILEVRSIAIKQFPVWGWPIWAWTKSNGRVYFTLTKDDAEIDGWDLLTHRELPCGAGQCYWSKSGSSGSRAVRFPVKTVKDSWVPVREGETERFESLIANLTNAVEIAPDGAAIRIKPKGKIQLHLWMDQGALVESFDITEDVLMKSGPTALRGGRASVEVLPAVGWIQLH